MVLGLNEDDERGKLSPWVSFYHSSIPCVKVTYYQVFLFSFFFAISIPLGQSIMNCLGEGRGFLEAIISPLNIIPILVSNLSALTFLNWRRYRHRDLSDTDKPFMVNFQWILYSISIPFSFVSVIFLFAQVEPSIGLSVEAGAANIVSVIYMGIQGLQGMYKMSVLQYLWPLFFYILYLPLAAQFLQEEGTPFQELKGIWPLGFLFSLLFHAVFLIIHWCKKKMDLDIAAYTPIKQGMEHRVSPDDDLT